MGDPRRPKPATSPRRARNLTLSDEAVERGERYSAQLGTSLSGLVDRLLRALPISRTPSDDELSPALGRLRRLLARPGRPADWRAEYREHLLRKHVAEGEP